MTPQPESPSRLIGDGDRDAAVRRLQEAYTGGHISHEELDLRTVWKATRYKPRQPSGPGGPKIRISGAMGMGRLKIRHARR